MGQRNDSVRSFDLLSPEILDIIFEKVVRDHPSFVHILARVNKAFRETEQRYRLASTCDSKPARRSVA
jgi:hypothetical protein